jgi:hypothetical protein
MSPATLPVERPDDKKMENGTWQMANRRGSHAVWKCDMRLGRRSVPARSVPFLHEATEAVESPVSMVFPVKTSYAAIEKAAGRVKNVQFPRGESW